jgi:hypothetical protein
MAKSDKKIAIINDDSFIIGWPISQTLSAKSNGAVVESNLLKRFSFPWSHYVRLLSVNKLFYERTLLSKNKAAMLKKGEKAKSEDAVTPEEEIKDPFVLEFLNLKDEYSENDLEEALIQHLEKFLLELGKFTHADAGQMHLYLNYARENWMHKDENQPVGLILCAEKDAAVARYALEERLPIREAAI